jgi:hypothetical protein
MNNKSFKPPKEMLAKYQQPETKRSGSQDLRAFLTPAELAQRRWRMLRGVVIPAMRWTAVLPDSGVEEDFENDDEREFVSLSKRAMAVHARKNDDLIIFTFENGTNKKLCCNEIDIPLGGLPEEDWSVLKSLLLNDYQINQHGLSRFCLVNTNATNVALKSISRGTQWQFAIGRWRDEAGSRWKSCMTDNFSTLMEKIDKDDPEDQEGTRGLWELSLRDDCLSFFTDDVLSALADTLDESEQEQVSTLYIIIQTSTSNPIHCLYLALTSCCCFLHLDLIHPYHHILVVSYPPGASVGRSHCMVALQDAMAS